MHELSVCRSMLRQVVQIARQHGATAVTAVRVRIGPLSGIEPQLLREAFPIAAAGGMADGARLVVESVPIRVRCRDCGSESDARANRLLCARCGSWKTRLIAGDELLLESVELGGAGRSTLDGDRPSVEGENHV